MAINGIHVVCGMATNGNVGGPLLNSAVWSFTQNTGTGSGVTSQNTAAPGKCLIRIYSSADVYVATGQSQALANSNAANGPRFYVPGATTYDFYANPGDYVAWVFA